MLIHLFQVAMSEGNDDFMDQIFLAEQAHYSNAYRNGLEFSAEGTGRQAELHSSWMRGVQCGAQLGSELYSYQGLAEEIIASTSSSNGETESNSQLVHAAELLLQMLNGPSGVLTVSSLSEFVKQSTFDDTLIKIRNKARQLLSLLGIQMINKKMNCLFF